jgi:Pyruvate/2-oxoacid:ferredoxin oxidoreductase gamma subunit
MSSQHPIIITGLGGQGVQLAAQTLCRARVLEGGHAQYFSFVGGVMRGGMSSAYVVLAEEEVAIPSLFDWALSALVLHRAHAAAALDRVDERSTVVLDPSMVDPLGSPARTVALSFNEIARAAEAKGAMSLVAVAGLAAIGGLVSSDALVTAMRESLPPYRRDRAGDNERAIVAGYAAGAEAATGAAVR